MSSWQANYLRRNKARRDLALYKKYIDQVGTTAFALPGDIDLYVSADAAVAANTPALIANSKTIYVGPKPDGTPRTAGYMHWAGRFGKGTVVQIQAGFTLCVDGGLGNYKQIGPA